MVRSSRSERFGAAVRRARIRQGVSQQQVADVLGLSQSIISRTERGAWPDVDRVVDLCILLDIDMREI